MNDKSQVLVSGNVKALIPLYRQHFTQDPDAGEQTVNSACYRKENLQLLREKRIFGILTKFQLGFIPNANICFTDGLEHLCSDTYLFRTLLGDSATCTVDVPREMHKVTVVNDHVIPAEEKVDQSISRVCTLK